MVLKHANGYTLIELVIVVVLIGLVFSFAAPRFRDAVLTDSLKSAARRLVNSIMEVRNKAIQEHEDYFLKFDLEKNEYWQELTGLTAEGRTFARERAVQMPDDIRITDIWVNQKGKTIGGEITLAFRKQGYAQQSAIHLESEDGRTFTIVVSPFLPQIRVLEKYIEFENS